MLITPRILNVLAATSILSICLPLFVESYIKPKENTRPVIGVLAQEPLGQLSSYGKEIIPAPYIKMIESAGGRPAVIKGGQPYEYYEKLFSQINGALFPGGHVKSIIDSKTTYARSGKYIFDLAVEANKRGDVFPIWSICLGFQMLTFLLSGFYVGEHCASWDQIVPLNYTKDYKNSRLFGAMPNDMITDLGTIPLAVNYHRSCVLYKDFVSYNMNKTIKLLSTNMDDNGTEFISTFEARDYPFFATQWHPEKSAFAFVSIPSMIQSRMNAPHHSRAVEINQWIARFFINYARRSNHRFPTNEAEYEVLVYNYEEKFLAPFGLIYDTVYIIKPFIFSNKSLVIMSVFGLIFAVVLYKCYKNDRFGSVYEYITSVIYKNKDGCNE